ncbi:MAG: ATP-binding protein [Victivallales bacterium]|nr:ATP-binding protein [Victivallales bacterium]
MLIGRDAEAKRLKDAFMSSSSEFIAVYGRRRVGKTYLIRETFDSHFAFYHTGIANVGRKEQLERFAKSLEKQGARHSSKSLKNWFEAFDRLEEFLQGMPAGKKVVFIDELPWMDTQHSSFTSALEAFWNGWASARNDIMLIVCGSATSWMTNKIINARGGLHNRLTHRIRLEAFSLSECERFLQAKGIVATRRQILEYYMVMGGIPYYWNYIAKGKSPAQNIDAIFFSSDGELRDEYSHLYASLFRNPQHHIAVVTALGTKKVGMTREELLKVTHLTDNGKFSQTLSELVECGFIRRYRMPGKRSHEALFQLMDNYTLFYFRFLSDMDEAESRSWSAIQNTPKVNTWRDLSFERVCLEHIDQLKKALGISGISTRQYAWRSHAKDVASGAQIDLLIERADKIVTICEMKYASGEYEITKDEHGKMLRRRDLFLSETRFRGAAYITLVTIDGAVHNAYWNDIQSELTLDDLFL